MIRTIATIAMAVVLVTCAQPSMAQTSTIFRGPPRGALDDRPADGSGLGQYTAIDCIDSTCSADSGSIWVTFRWNGSAWEIPSGSGASTFDELGSGTNTSATLSIGTGAALLPTGSGAVLSNGLLPNSIDATTDFSTGLCADGQAIVKTGGVWTCGAASGAANLGTTVAADQVTVTNDAGTPAVIPAATTTTAGAMSAANRRALDAVRARQFRVEEYASGSATGGIVEALAACAAAGGGSVLGPGGSISIDATGLQTPIVELPALERDGDDVYFGACRWSAYDDGSERQILSNPKAASFVLFDNMDLALPDGNGYRPAIQVTADGQDLRGLNIGIAFSPAPDTDDANSVRGVLLQSKTPRVGVDRDLGQDSINNFSLEGLTVAGAPGNRLGVGIEFQFALKGTIRNNHVSNFYTDVRYAEVPCDDTSPPDGLCDFDTSHSAPVHDFHSNNANLWSGNTLRTAIVGFDADGLHSCGDVQFVGNTIEGIEVLPLYFHNDSRCHVIDSNVHYEAGTCENSAPADDDCDDLTDIAAADQAQVYIDSDGVTYSAFGVRYNGNAPNSIYRSLAHEAGRSDLIVGTWHNRDIKYESGVSLNICATANESGSRTGGGHFLETCLPVGDEFAACATGRVKGGGFDAASGDYDWTCGNFNWSAEIGGIDGSNESDYDTPTTVGGNSWTMTCTGDGTSSTAGADAVEAAACLFAGEEIRMYSSADALLAQDNTRDGGAVYFPPGLYHFANCGKQADDTPNGCPVSKRDPSHQMRRPRVERQIRWIAAGSDPDKLANGRSGTYWISDHGNVDHGVNHSVGAPVDDYGGVGTYDAKEWAFMLGAKEPTNRCQWSGTGCNVAASTVQSIDHHTLSPLASGHSSAVLRDDFGFTQGGTGPYPSICLNDQVSISGGADGVCDGNLTGSESHFKIQCDEDADCPGAVVGSCVGHASAIASHIANFSEGQISYLGVKLNARDGYGSDGESNLTHTWFAPIQEVRAVGCSSGGAGGGTGRLVRLGNPEVGSGAMQTAPGVLSYDASEQPGTAVYVDHKSWFMGRGGFYGFTMMPSVWVGRTGGTAESTCAGINGQYCDEYGFLMIGGTYGGVVEDVGTMFCNGSGDSQSCWDGDASGHNQTIRNSWSFGTTGLLMDGGSWKLDNFTVEAADASNRSLMAISFAELFEIDGLHVLASEMETLLQFQRVPGADLRRIFLYGNEAQSDTDSLGGFLDLSGARNVAIDGVYGTGNSGVPILVRAVEGLEPWSNTIRNVKLDAHLFSRNNAAKGVIVVTDGQDHGTMDESEHHGFLTIEDVSVSFSGNESGCGIWLDGMTGDESDQQNGLNRTIDDWRDRIDVDGLAIELVDDNGDGNTGTWLPVCLADSIDGPYDGDDVGILTESSAVGPLPTWRRVTVNDVRHPDRLSSGQISIGGNGEACAIFADSDNAGFTACEYLNGVQVCEVDTNGVCGDGL